MKDNTDIKISSNIKAVAAGAAIAYSANLVFAPILRYLLILLFGYSKNDLIFNYLYFSNLFEFKPETSEIQFLFIHFFVFISLVVLIESGNYLFLKTAAGFTRFLLIAFQIFNIGYLLFWVIKGVVSLIIYPYGSNDIVQISNFFEVNENGRIVFAFALLIFTFFYTNASLGRLKKYLVLPQKL